MEENQEKQPGQEPVGPPPVPEIPVLNDREIRRAVRMNSYPTWKDILSIIGVFFVAQIVAGLIFIPMGAQQGGFPLFMMYVTQFALTIAYALFLKKRRSGTFRNVMYFSFKGFNPMIILWGVIMMLAIGVVIEPLLNLFPDEWINLLNDKISSGGWAMVTTIIAAPIFEEILFRGIIQDSLTRKYGAWRGIVVASCIFGIIHLIPQQVVGAMLIGMVIGYIYYKTRSLLSAMVLHGINNALAVFSMMFIEDSTVSIRQSINSDTIYYTLYVVCAVLVFLSLLQVIRLIRSGKLDYETRLAEQE